MNVLISINRFVGNRVLELGSGCGLAGIVAARFAEHVTMTDYLLNVCICTW